MLELDDGHLLVNGVEILMLAFRPVGVYLHFTLRTAPTKQCLLIQYVENQYIENQT